MTSTADFFGQNDFTLALSSGYFGFFAHIGFAKALDEVGLKPKSYCGSSAGALVSASLASGLPALEIEKIFTGIQRRDFWDPRPGFGFLKGEKFEKVLSQYIHKDYSKLSAPLSVSTFDIFSRKTKNFTQGELPKICRASCAIPGFFHPVVIEGRPYWDGGIFDKMGVHGLSQDTLILSHYLQADNWADRFERFRTEFQRSPRTHLIQLENLPQSGPTKLDRGPEIIAASYEKTLKALRQPAPESLLQSLR